METMQILSGNEILIQGGLEAGFSLYTGYPGSPLADFFNILNSKRHQLQKQGIRVVLANSEANAAAMASGAKLAGHNTFVGMKSMGLHVAADALSVGNFANPGKTWVDEKTGEELRPGVVVAVGDDPWSISTSTPADSRYLFRHLHMPFLCPSTPQELKDWVGKALEISQRSGIYIGLLLTTSLAEGGGRVSISPQAAIEGELVKLDPTQFDLAQNVMVPPNSFFADKNMILERFPKMVKILEQLKLDQVYHAPDKEQLWGIVTIGVVACDVLQYLGQTSWGQSLPVYKLACAYPMAEVQLLPFLKKIKNVIVIEEKRDFVESELRLLVQKNSLQCQVYGKDFQGESLFPSYGGITVNEIAQKLPRVRAALEGVTEEKCQVFSTPAVLSSLPKRLPTFCPGCPHRETLSLLKELRGDLKKKDIDLISHGDVGCYSLSFLPPFKEMHDLSAMGQGGAMASGTDIFSNNPAVVLMGDSTFYHSGLTAISHSLQLNHSITYILLDNDNTAMTGHQMTPVTGVSVEGQSRPRQDMLKLVKAMGVSDCTEVNPSDRYFYKNLLWKWIERPGTKVIVSNKECGLTYHSQLRKKERQELKQNQVIEKKEYYWINPTSCEDCRVCVDMTGCPGLTRTEDPYGTKVAIDLSICVADSYCTKLKACPSFEKITVNQYRPPSPELKLLAPKQSLPLPQVDPAFTFEQIASGQNLEIVVLGVGGSGVTTFGRVLAKASLKMGGREDIDFKFFDQKGLAQRNGAVVGHMSFFAKGKHHSTETPKNSATLLVAPDLLEGARGLPFLAPTGYAFIDSDYQVPVDLLISGGDEDFNGNDLRRDLKKILKHRLVLVPYRKIAQKLLGRAVYSPTLALGHIFQLGRLPFTLEDVLKAIEKAVPAAEVEKNKAAFELGRQLVESGVENFLADNQIGEEKESFGVEEAKASLREAFLTQRRGKKVTHKLEAALKELVSAYPGVPKEHWCRYLHDILLYDKGRHIKRIKKDFARLYHLYHEIGHFPQALSIYIRTCFIKDEVFIAHTMIAPPSRRLREQAFGHLGQGHSVDFINRPSFDFGPWTLEFDISPKFWMLKFMRHLRFMRLMLPTWHHRERKINSLIRKSLFEDWLKQNLGPAKVGEKLKKLNSIKGYRQHRYRKAGEVFKQL